MIWGEADGTPDLRVFRTVLFLLGGEGIFGLGDGVNCRFFVGDTEGLFFCRDGTNAEVRPPTVTNATASP